MIKSHFLERVRQAIRVLHFSIQTEWAYVAWIKRYIPSHQKRHPIEMSKKEISELLTRLAYQQKIAVST